MINVSYSPEIVGTIIKSEQDQLDRFYLTDNPLFLIPEFDKDPKGILDSYSDYLSNRSININSGEFIETQVFDNGLTECTYVAYDDDNGNDYYLDIKGYIVEQNNTLYFMVTNIKES
jgi:hypothetical protein